MQAIRTSGKAFLSEPTFAGQPVFSGRGGRDIVTARDGRVLVFHGHSLRESEDGGITWSPPREVGPDAGGKVIVNETNGEILYIHAVAPIDRWTAGEALHDLVSLSVLETLNVRPEQDRSTLRDVLSTWPMAIEPE